MRFLPLTLLLSLCASFAYGQFDLTRSNFPSIGDTTIFYRADSTPVNEQSAGTNQTWDFTNDLTLTGDSTVQIYRDPNNVPGAGAFPNANMVSEIAGPGGGIKTFIEANNNQIEILGEVIPTSQVTYELNYDDNLKQFDYPLQYNDSFYDPYKGKDSVQVGGGTSIKILKGYNAMKYDGSGSIQTDSGTFNNAIRIKNDIKRKDSTVTIVSGASTSQVTINETTSYIWFDKNNPSFPVLRISYVRNEVRTQVTNTVNYRKIVDVTKPLMDGPDSSQSSNIKSESPVQKTMTFPNPASSEFNVVFSIKAKTNLSLVILNTKGQQVAKQEFGRVASGNFHHRFNTEALQAGNYILQIRTDEGVKTRKFVVN